MTFLFLLLLTRANLILLEVYFVVFFELLFKIRIDKLCFDRLNFFPVFACFSICLIECKCFLPLWILNLSQGALRSIQSFKFTYFDIFTQVTPWILNEFIIRLDYSFVLSLISPTFDFQDGWSEKLNEADNDVHNDVHCENSHHRVTSEIYFELRISDKIRAKVLHVDHRQNTELVKDGHRVVQVTFVGHVDVVDYQVKTVNEETNE
jgi:hypothetical protein